ncbi:hypothetical protein AB205_0137720 [Aquarana catesbeiana]|uniref:Uncharacterized protein n=1 Tax=Aquarana catesbeiana TaxID=8400 RepID=A0A2G9P826_AQUCT|nr:hypothetical protein AB205_0137720 [Aquarana catesbeiana]
MIDCDLPSLLLFLVMYNTVQPVCKFPCHINLVGLSEEFYNLALLNFFWYANEIISCTLVIFFSDLPVLTERGTPTWNSFGFNQRIVEGSYGLVPMSYTEMSNHLTCLSSYLCELQDTSFLCNGDEERGRHLQFNS